MRQILNRSVLANLKMISPDDPSFVEQIVTLFDESVPPQLEQMEAALARGEIELVGKIAHGMVSAADNVGAVAMSEVCRELINLGRGKAIGNAGDLITLLRTLFNQTRVELKSA